MLRYSPDHVATKYGDKELVYYSPGVEYLCHRCNSNQVRFIFDNNFRGRYNVMCLIKEKKVKLSHIYKDYLKNPSAPKWLCYNCYDCGIVIV